jgi:carboxylesterase type B
LEKVVEKLIESTTDAFFNIPAILTADLWGKYSPAFFYQFDHVSDSESSGKKFLRPLPLVSKRSSKSMIAHGDELGLLFEVNDVFGNKINDSSIKSTRDKNASKNLIEIIQKFAYFNSNITEQFKIGEKILSPFRAQATNFIKISDKLSFEKDFRFCQLSLFGAQLQASQKISCEFLSEGLKKLPTVPMAKDILGGNKFGFI